MEAERERQVNRMGSGCYIGGEGDKGGREMNGSDWGVREKDRPSSCSMWQHTLSLTQRSLGWPVWLFFLLQPVHKAQ